MEVALAIVAMADQIHSEFLRLLWVLADKQTRNYASKNPHQRGRFMWSRVCKFRCNTNTIGKAIVYATATRLHVSSWPANVLY